MKLISIVGVVVCLSGVAPHRIKDPMCALRMEQNGIERGCTTTAGVMRYTYHLKRNRCKKFKFYGCNGNNNNFPSRFLCELICKISFLKTD